MKILSDTFKKTGAIHHAYALEGDKAEIFPDLMKFLENDFGIEIKNNPDFSFQEFETFTIDDSRALKELHGRRAISGKKIFIICTRFMILEAQNALLKIFEEPSEGAHFFLIMPNTQVLIPTLKSRLVIVGRAESDNDGKEMMILAKKFLSASPAARIALVKNIVEEKDKGKAIAFVTALEKTLEPKLKTNKELSGDLTEILSVKKYLHDRAPSIKLLLEHLCLFVTIIQL